VTVCIYYSKLYTKMAFDLAKIQNSRWLEGTSKPGYR